MKRKNKLLTFVLIFSMLLPFALPAGLPASAVDDYPAKWKNPARHTVIDDWGNGNRECVAWVTWCLSSRNGYDLDPTGRNWNAINWAGNARDMGVEVNKTPAVGSVAWWDLSKIEEPGWGHTAWVAEVDGDYITIEEYNVIPKNGGKYSRRVIKKTSPHAYIHFKDIKSTGSYYCDRAARTTSQIIINGEKIDFCTYTVNGETHFNINDIAYSLRNTRKRFNVIKKSDALYLETGHSYKITGEEMQSKSPDEKDADLMRNAIFVLGKEVKFTAYEIDGNIYFKLSELQKAFGLDLKYDSAGKTYVIDTGDSTPAKPLNSAVYINGQKIEFDAYEINGGAYFKIRDVAFALNGTGAQFNVNWDFTHKISKIIKNQAYVPQGGEMNKKSAETKASKTAGTKLNIDGKEVSFNIYVIDGISYFNIEDLAKTIGFALEYNNASSHFSIDAGHFAKSLTSAVLVNGRESKINAYEIQGTPYFNIRDIAHILNGTGKQFKIAYDPSGIYKITAMEEYVPGSGETGSDRKTAEHKTASAGSAKLNIDGKEVSLNTYTIDGNDYFNIAGLGKEIGFDVVLYGGAAKAFVIDAGELAVPLTSTVLVNGEETKTEAYTINGSNYFKIRDLAYILSGTEKQFEVGWDDANNAVSLRSRTPYTVVGGELRGGSAGKKTAKLTAAKIYLDGQRITVTVYNIGGNNYIKLRDIGEAFDFGVDWDGAQNVIVIDTSKRYTE